MKTLTAMKKYVISVGRQFGSGGHDIGKKLAERLGIKFYDKELLLEAAKEIGANPELFKKKRREAPVILHQQSVNEPWVLHATFCRESGIIILRQRPKNRMRHYPRNCRTRILCDYGTVRRFSSAPQPVLYQHFYKRVTRCMR